MKKSLLALAIAAVAAASTSASAATIYSKDGTSIDAYGRVMAVFYSQDYCNDNTASNDGNFNSSSRLGFNFRSEINSLVTAVANVEWEMAAEDGTTKSRYTWVGADLGQYGLLKIGKFEDAVKYVIGPTDVFEDAGCNGLLNNDDRRSGMFMYSWSHAGFDVNASYGTAKDDQQVDGAFWTTGEDSSANDWDNDKEAADIKYSYAFSVGYTTPDVLFGPISIKAGFGGAQFQEREDAEDYTNVGGVVGGSYLNNSYDNYEQWAASISWGTLGQGLYTAVAFQTRSFDFYGNGTSVINGVGIDANEYDVTGAEFVISYGFANGVTLIGGYNWMEVDYDFVAGANVNNISSDAKSSVIPVIAQWQIIPSLKVWAEARFDAGTDDEYAAYTNGVYAHNDENVFALGAKYTF